MRRPWDAIVWWEIRRIPFNLVVLAVGALSGRILFVIGNRLFGPNSEFGDPFLGVVLYAIGANLCYTLGWTTELLWSWGNTAQTESVRPKIFRAGLIMSAVVTLLPAAILSLFWLIYKK